MRMTSLPYSRKSVREILFDFAVSGGVVNFLQLCLLLSTWLGRLVLALESFCGNR